MEILHFFMFHLAGRLSFPPLSSIATNIGFHISLVTSTVTELGKGEDQEHPSLNKESPSHHQRRG